MVITYTHALIVASRVASWATLRLNVLSKPGTLSNRTQQTIRDGDNHLDSRTQHKLKGVGGQLVMMAKWTQYLRNIYDNVEIRDWVNCSVSNVDNKCMFDDTQLFDDNVYIESFDCLSDDNVSHIFSEHTCHAGRSDQDQGTGRMASCQFYFQGCHGNPACVPSANHNGDGTYNSVINMFSFVPSICDSWEVEQMRPNQYVNHVESDTCDTTCQIDNVSIDYFMVHFTNWQYYHDATDSIVYIVYIDNFDAQKSKKPYYFHIDSQQNATVFHCHEVQDDLLTVVNSSWWLTTRNIVNNHCQHSDTIKDLGTDQQGAHENYQKDSFI